MQRHLLLLFTFVCHVWLYAQPSREDIAPLIKTRWGQGVPYNLLCPTIGGLHCQTGCVATAMAQIMNFYQFPALSEGIPAYQTASVSVDSLPPVAFDWAHMLDQYNSTASVAEQEAVAQLMQYCGAAVQMDYGVGSSAAWEGDAARALVRYFGYAPSVHEIFRNMYGRTAWENLLYKELSAGYPVFYSGMPSGYLHQFVCDGYKEGKFHFNLAWQFSQDGYYSLSAIDRYPEGQAAIIGIRTADTTPYGQMFTVDDQLTYTVISSDEVSVRAASTHVGGDITIPSTVTFGGHIYHVTTIEYSAFEDCATLTRLRLPATIDVIGRRMTIGCLQLSAIEIDSNPWYMTNDGVLMNTAMDELIVYPIDKADNAYVLPDGIEEICASLFRDNTHLQQLTIPASVKFIDILAFRGCTSLTTVVSLNPQPSAIEDMAFDDETYETCTLVVPQGSIDRYRRQAGWRHFRNIVEDSSLSVTLPTVQHQSDTFFLLNGILYQPMQNKAIHVGKGMKIYLSK